MVSMHVFLDALRRTAAERPVAARLGALALAGFAVGAILAAAGMGLLAQLVGGLALVPLSLAIYLCLMPARFWSDGGHDGGWGDDGGGPPSPGGPSGEVDWESFERQFWTHVEDREPVEA
jgi:hypothetical protein